MITYYQKVGTNSDNLSIRRFAAYNDEMEGKLHDYGLPRFPVEAIIAMVDALRKTAMRVHVYKNDWNFALKIYTGNLNVTDFGLSNQDIYVIQRGSKSCHDIC